ncbi:MAG: 6-pyruvoyl-tetrahydropterin synthase-related protein [Acidobacteriota bacterium]
MLNLKPKSETSAHEGFTLKRVLPIGVIIGVATLLMLPTFIFGFPAGYDAVRHYRWTWQFSEALGDGAIFPRWLPTANHHQGSPVALYYPPLPFYVAAFFDIFVGTLPAMALSCWTSLMISAAGMYKLARNLLPCGYSLFAAIIYSVIPYHIYDLYQGTAVSEFWSFAWIPFLFNSIYHLSLQKNTQHIFLLASNYALLLFTHVPIAFLTSLLLPILAILLTRKFKNLWQIACGLLLGLGLAAIFIVPIVFEREFVKLQFKFNYQDYFLFKHIDEAFNSALFAKTQTPQSYLLETNVMAVGVAVFFLAITLTLWKTWRWRQENPAGFKLTAAVWALTACCILITTRATRLVWQWLPGLPMLFFPVRFFVVACVGLALLSAIAWWILKASKRRVIYGSILALAMIFNLVISYLAVVRAPHSPEKLQDGLSQREVREYRPIWWNADLESWRNVGSPIVESGEALVRVIDDRGINQSYEITARQDSNIVFRPMYFPGWTAEINGEPVVVEPSASGNLLLKIAPGDYRINLKFADTLPRQAGKIISILSLLIFISLSIWLRYQSGKSLSTHNQ